MSFLTFNLYLSYKKTKYSFSLFTFFGDFFSFLKTLIKVDYLFIYYFKYVFWYCVFLISHHKVFSLPFIT